MEGWRRCGPCKNMIGFDTKYYVCSVSTCRKHVFCSQDCWRAHVPLMRHKDAWAEEELSPKENTIDSQSSNAAIGSRKIVSQISEAHSTSVPKEVLIVASKLKAYVKAKSGLNTSANVLEKLSDIVRSHCDKAIEEAKRNGRKTLMDRDFYS